MYGFILQGTFSNREMAQVCDCRHRSNTHACCRFFSEPTVAEGRSSTYSARANDGREIKKYIAGEQIIRIKRWRDLSPIGLALRHFGGGCK